MNSTARSALIRPRLRRGPLVRVLAGLWLVLHVVAVAVLPVADGFTDHGDAVVVHVEETGGSDCPAAHDESCDLCQFAHGMRALVARGAVFSTPAIARRTLVPDAASVAPADLEFLDGHSSRAPPVLG